MGKMLILLLSGMAIVIVLIEIGLPKFIEAPLKSGDFYSSLSETLVAQRQVEIGVQWAAAEGWAHLGWIADPDHETYLVERLENGQWIEVASVEYGSFTTTQTGDHVFRVYAVNRDHTRRLLGEASVSVKPNQHAVYRPKISAAWQPLFIPDSYANDHTVFFNDVLNKWQVISITSENKKGDYNQEKHFAVGYSDGPEFPPTAPIRQSELIVDTGQLAWAPHVLKENDKFFLFWSPHTLYQMESLDGQDWEETYISMQVPYHKFFRDPMVLKVAPNQWLLYTTAKGKNGKSRIDLYQSFNLKEWQYIGCALNSGAGSERNSPFASFESPFVFEYQGRFYLSVTYNNDTPAYNGILLSLKIWPNRSSYNDTLIFNSLNPYDFGVYQGHNAKSTTFLTQLEAHAPEYVVTPGGDWYITTAGWPWVATLTQGEVAVAPLTFEKISTP